MLFFVMTKNLNWKISTKTLVTFKKRDEVNDEIFYYYAIFFWGGGGGIT